MERKAKGFYLHGRAAASLREAKKCKTTKSGPMGRFFASARPPPFQRVGAHLRVRPMEDGQRADTQVGPYPVKWDAAAPIMAPPPGELARHQP